MDIPFIYDVKKWLDAIEVDDVLCSATPTLKKIVESNKPKKSPKIEPDYINIKEKNIAQKITLNNEVKKDVKRLSSLDLASKANNLDELKTYVSNFDGCDLKFAAQNTVFSDGNRNSEIMFIGEAPGASEDEQGIPFCGRSGKLLDEIISSIGLYRTKNCYITNTVFWRPPANRAPTDEEVEICKPFIEKHIALFNPKLLILVGGTAVTSLLGKQYQISKIRNSNFDYQNQFISSPIKTTALFHPAYLLRNPMKKKDTWYDLLRIKDYLDSNNIKY